MMPRQGTGFCIIYARCHKRTDNHTKACKKYIWSFIGYTDTHNTPDNAIMCNLINTHTLESDAGLGGHHEADRDGQGVGELQR